MLLLQLNIDNLIALCCKVNIYFLQRMYMYISYLGFIKVCIKIISEFCNKIIKIKKKLWALSPIIVRGKRMSKHTVTFVSFFFFLIK